MTDIVRRTAHELAQLYASGAVSPRQTIADIVNQISDHNADRNAFCFFDLDSVIQQAMASQQRWQQQQPLSAVDGIPVAVKDLLHVKGWPTLKGSLAIDPNHLELQDSPVIAQLRDQGVVFVGKTTTSEFGSKMYVPTVKNPWNPQYLSGGSSAGSAVAVATGMVPVAVGTDYAGSVIAPASFCGTLGFKPSYNQLTIGSTSKFQCGAVGWFANAVEDLSLLTNTDIADVDLPQIKIALCYDLGFGKIIDPAIVQALDQVASALSQAGACVDRIPLVIEDPSDVCSGMFLFEMFQQCSQLSIDQQRMLSDCVKDYANQGSKITQSQASRLQLYQKHVQKTMRLFMQKYQIILSASTVVSADGFDPDQLATNNVISYLYNLSHQPCITVPVGLNQNHVPVGIMLAGAVHSDALVLGMAKIIADQFVMPVCPVIL